MVEKPKLNKGKYAIERSLGSGRFSQTFLAYHTAKPDERLVIKVTEFNPEISDRVKNAIEKGMAIERKDRPQTVKAWLNQLGGYRLSLDCFDSPKWSAVGAIATVVSVLVGVVGVYFGFMSFKNPTPSPEVEPTPKQLKIKNGL